MLFGHNTRSTGNNADDMSEVFHDITQFERFTDLINLRSMSIKTGKQMREVLHGHATGFCRTVSFKSENKYH